jgi:hypothetical protein
MVEKINNQPFKLRRSEIICFCTQSPQNGGNAEGAKGKAATGARAAAAVSIYEIRCMIYDV